MPIKIAPYKLGSASARALAQGLGVLRVRNQYVPKYRDHIINWGRSTLVTQYPNKVINKPEAVAKASNKLLTFKSLADNGFYNVPKWTIYKTTAKDMLEIGNKVYCRTTLTGHSGSGIVIANTVGELVDAPLYTVDTKHDTEYRVHVFKGEVIDVQQKKKRNGSNATTEIRNHSNGWIFARSGITVPDSVQSASILAVGLLELDFGAVDVGYKSDTDSVFVFEINTAPGLEGTTLDKYVNKFKEYYNVTL